MINQRAWGELTNQFNTAEPYNHVTIDNFWQADIAEQLAQEFPAYDSASWNAHYQSPLEDKKACNAWDRFPALTYRAFSYLNTQEFLNIVESITGTDNVKADVGLHGGGWHAHHRGGKLNVHLDYSIHPKLGLERHYNLIIYMTPNWDHSWGGGLELWSHNEDGSAKECVTTVENRFNRAVLFDTTQYSWHGLPDHLTCPEGINRQSMAIYYLTEPAANADPRGKALYIPTKEQQNDPEVLDLIVKRS